MIETAPTIPMAFTERVRMAPGAVAYREAIGGDWREIPWSEVAQRVARRRAALAEAELQVGDRVAIFLPNGIEWVVTDLAAMAQGLVTVPLYLRDSAANIVHVLRDSEAALCVTDKAHRFVALGHEIEGLPNLQQVWVLSTQTRTTDARVFPCPDFEAVEELAKLPSGADQLATIIYTSGTTGPPKGVMLNHNALLWNARAVNKVNRIETDDLFLSILPLAHAFERTLGWLCPMLSGATVAYAQSIETLAADLADQKPTILLAVPRLFEKAHHKAVEQAEANALGGWLLKNTERIGWARHLSAEVTGQPLTLSQRLFWTLLGQHVAKRVGASFGGRLRMVLSGGAPLSEATYRFMAAMEVPLIEGYGLTEAGPAVTGSTLADRRFGSVGRPLPGAEVKTGNRQELLVRSPGVMMGYWRNPQASAEAVDEEGWLHTGDVAEIFDGRVEICGRLKDILVLSTGENVNPLPIETAVLTDPLVDQACVLGDGKPWCSAVVVVDADKFGIWAKEVCPEAQDVNDRGLSAALTKRLSERMEQVPPFGRIRAVYVETNPWSLESGLITPTLKAKRTRIAARYAQKLESLYS